MSSGIAFHCHHDKLVEYVWDDEERVAYIKASKPEGERPLRLKLFKLIPPELLPPTLDRARAKVDRARNEVKRARAEWDRAWDELGGARAKGDRARNEVGRARAEWDRALGEWERARAELDSVIRANLPALEELHTRLCPNCPWDGKTIFPEK